MIQQSHNQFLINDEHVNRSVQDLFLLFQQDVISVETLAQGLRMLASPLIPQVPHYNPAYPYQMWFHFGVDTPSITIFDIERAFTDVYARFYKERIGRLIATGLNDMIRVYIS